MKISEGIDYAIQQALEEDLVKTASADDTPDVTNTKLSTLLRRAANNVRQNGVDVEIKDLQEFGEANQ
jgi:hypothetical protein